MKSRNLLLILFSAVSFSAAAQNTFPSTGSAGVGTTSPATLLHVYRNASGNTTPMFYLDDDYISGFTQMAFRGTARTFNMGVGNATAGVPYQSQFFIVDAIVGKPRFLIDSSGLVQVGSSLFNGGGKFAIYPTTANNSGLQFLRLSNTAGASASNGKVLSVDGSGNVILVADSLGTAGWGATGNSGTSSSTNFIGTSDNQDLVFKTNNTERYRLYANGNIKIGAGADKSKTFQVNGTGYFSNSIGIGTDSINDTNYKLFVAQGIRTRKVKVDVSAWPDYVFNSEYELTPLNEVEQYITDHKHLPGIISAEQVHKDGVNLGDNQADLLKKIEELTLYVIEQNKSLQLLQQQSSEQKIQISELAEKLKERK